MAYYSKLSPSDAGSIGSQPNFGEEVGIGNGKVAVGAPLADDGATLNRGAVYVYDLDGTNELKITPSAYPGVAIQFGQNVSIGSNKILVGTGADVCFLYDLDGTNEVVIDPGYTSSNFGFDKQGIKIYKDKIYISDSNLASNVRSQVGAVYIYRLSDQALLKVVRPSDSALDPTSMDTAFGYSIDVEDNLLVVGAPQTGKSGSTGKVYVYDLDGNHERIFEASDGVPGDYLGWKVGLDRGRVIASARLWHPSRDGVTSGRGAAYSWKYDGSDERMFRQRKVYGTESSGDAFSEDSLVAGGGRVYIGARYFENGGRQGSVFSYTGRGLGEYNFLSSDPSASSGDHFSYSLDYDNGYLVVGSVFFGTPVVGAAYVYQVAAPSGKIRNLSSRSTGYGAPGPGTFVGSTLPVVNPAGYLQFGQSNTTGITGPFDYNDGSDQDFTVEAWVWGDDWNANGDSYNAILNRSDGTSHIFSVFINSSGEMASWYFNTSGAITPSTSSTDGDPALTLSTGTWNHCVWIHNDGAGMEYYLNNSAASTYSNTNPRRKDNSNQTFTIGKWNQNSYELHGRIGQLRFYKRKLFTSEISRNFNATRGKYGV